MKPLICLVAVAAILLAAPGVFGAEAATVQVERSKVLAQLEGLYAQEADHYQRIQKELQSLSGRTDVSAEGLQKTASRLDDQLEALMFEDVGAKARINALSESIAELTKKAEESAARDEAIDELKKVVAARERAVERMMALKNNAAVSAEEVERTRAELSEAKIRLMDRQRNITATAGGDALAAWNRELINLAIGAHEREARKDALHHSVDRIRGALSRLPELQLQEEKMKAARAKLMSASYKFKADEP